LLPLIFQVSYAIWQDARSYSITLPRLNIKGIFPFAVFGKEAWGERRNSFFRCAESFALEAVLLLLGKSVRAKGKEYQGSCFSKRNQRIKESWFFGRGKNLEDWKNGSYALPFCAEPSREEENPRFGYARDPFHLTAG
jgi:hypothetical protein